MEGPPVVPRRVPCRHGAVVGEGLHIPLREVIFGGVVPERQRKVAVGAAGERQARTAILLRGVGWGMDGVWCGLDGVMVGFGWGVVVCGGGW